MTADTERNTALLNEIVPAVVAGTAPPLIVLAGPAGAGRSTLLDQIGEALATHGVRAQPVHCSPPPFAAPLHAVLESVADLSTSDEPRGVLRAAPAERFSTVQGTPATAAASIAAALAKAGVAVLLIDDVQWLDQRSLGVLEQLVRLQRLTCVCTVALPPATTARAALRRLSDDGLARVLAVRPLGLADIASIAARAVQGRPDRGLVEHLRRATAGNQAALHGALAEYQRAGVIHMVAGTAYLVAPDGELPLSERHQLVAAVRRMGAEVWRVAKATAVLHPLGRALPELVSAATATDVAEVRWALGMLHASGVLRRAGESWRFRIGLVEATILAQLGPYERRHLAQTAITALWQGAAECDDLGYRADQLAAAGKLVDARRAYAELLDHADAMDAEPGSERWVRAAANLVADPARRAALLTRYALTCFRHGDYRNCLTAVENLLRDDSVEIADDLLDELAQVTVLARHAVGEQQPVPDTDDNTDARTAITAATTSLALGRPRECLDVLDRPADHWRARPAAARIGHLLRAQANLFAGDRAGFESEVGAAAGQPLDNECRRREFTQVRLLPALLAGEIDDAEKRLIAEGMTADQLALPYQAVLALQRNRFELGEDLAHRAVATGMVPGCAPAYSLVYQWLAHIRVARGELAHGRALLAAGRAAGVALPHLLDGVEASIDAALGDYEAARVRLCDALNAAAAAGVVLGTDQLLAQLAEVELRLGNPEAARKCAAAAGISVRHLVAQAIVDQDQHLAERAVRLAMEHAQPLEVAITVGRLAAHGLGPNDALVQAYALLEDLDALLYRSWLRHLMRERNIPVPGRTQTVVENERLLAALVADGLSNKELATVLQASEKSVEGRLSRLFTRTGYQSRVALATAVHSGEYRP